MVHERIVLLVLSYFHVWGWAISLAAAEKVTYYVSPTVGVDSSDCGSSVSSPCFSLYQALNNTLLLKTNVNTGTTECFTSSGEQVTIELLEGDHVVDPLCFTGVRDLTISGSGPFTGIRSSVIGNLFGILAFFDCQEITISNLTFIDSITGRGSIYARNTSELKIMNCDIPVYADGARGVWLKSPQGTTSILNTKFLGNPTLVKYENLSPGSALYVSVGSEFGYFFSSDQLTDSVLLPADIRVVNCTFAKLISTESYQLDVDNYQTSSTQSKVVQVLLNSGAINNAVSFVGCTFEFNANSIGSIALSRFGAGTTGNTVEYRGCIFQNNLARYGGGIATYFSGNAEYNNVTISDCTFSNNEASLEGGGVFMATLAQNPMLNLYSIDNCLFCDNLANYGASIFLFNDPTLYLASPDLFFNPFLPLMSVNIMDSQFKNNKAQLDEGIINTLRIQLELSGKNILTDNEGSAIVLRSSTISLGDEILFAHNKAEKGGALKILDRSLISMSQLVIGNFTSNMAMYSGGALYADESSTTITADQYNHTFANIALGSCFIQFPYNSEGKAVLYFNNNTAISEGNDFAIYCVRSCSQNYFIPEPFDQFALSINNNPVVIETDNPLGVISTGPTYLFFYGASTKCYKTVANLTYLLPNCSHQLLMDNFDGLSELSCGVSGVIDELEQEFIPGHGMFHPLTDQLILPWADIGNSWMLEPGNKRSSCNEPNPGQLTLSPAPGEKFDLTVQLADQLLNVITSTVFLQIDHSPGVSPGVLIQLNGIQWGYNDRVYFTPNRVIPDITLVGLPGTRGYINVVSQSQILGLDIILQIPFQLSQCPLGYYNPPMMGSSTDKINTVLYSDTQRIPVQQPLACQCFVDSDVQFGGMVKKYTSTCVGGYTVNLNGILWAGLIPSRANNHTTDLDEPSTTTCHGTFDNRTDQLSLLIKAARARQLEILGTSRDPDTNPIDVVPYEEGLIPGGGAPVKCYHNYTINELVNFEVNRAEFSVDLCTRGFCRGSTETSWFLADIDYPCTENRQGVLCGQCKPGLSLTMTTTKCQDCSNPRWYVPLVTSLFIGLLLVVSVVALNIGVTPTIDTFLFFIQAVYIIVSSRLDYRNFEMLSIFNLDFTFNQCILKDLQALPRLLLQYVTPLYILCLLLIIILLSKSKGFSKYFGRHSCLKALWLLLLISYLNISNSTFEILNCQYIGPSNRGFREYVLVYDASNKCWTGLHLPFAIIAVVLALFLILPFPLYAGLAIKVPKWKPITDVYCGVYRDEQRYWIIWNLLRRVLIVMIGVFVTDFILRHFSLLLTTIVILVASVSTWPYRYWLDNAFSTFVLVALVLFCVVTQPEVYSFADPSRIVSWMIVAIVSLVTIFLLCIEIGFWWMSRNKSETPVGMIYSKDLLTPSKAKDKLCESLAGIFSIARSKMARDRQFTELEESVHSNEYYDRENALKYKEFREPLIDSINFSSLRVSTAARQNSTVTTQELNFDNPVINSPNLYATSKTVVTHSVVEPDKNIDI